MSAHEANPGKPKGQPPKKASWRKSGAAGPAGAAAAARGWSKTKPVASGPSDRSVKIAALGLLLVGLVVAYILFVFFRPRGLPIIALAVSQYDSGLIPPNAWAQEDSARLGKLEQAEMVKAAVAAGAATDLLSALDRQLAAAPKGGGPDKNVLVVVLAAHGVVNDKREPCLLMENSDPLDDRGWLRLQEVFEKLDKHPSAKHKLLVLDCQRQPANWSMGILHNDFAERVAELSAGLDSVVVISSAGPGQTALGAPELGGSVFGFYLAAALAGEADGAIDGHGDGRVTLQEAMRFLRVNVDQWALEHREARQQPVILPPSREKEDFALIYNATRPPHFAPPDPPRDSMWQTVAELWQQHDRLAEQHYLRYDPVGWNWFERQLLRLEQTLVAGKAYESDADRISRTLVEWAGPEQSAGRLARRIAPGGLVAASLPLARQWSAPAADEVDALAAAWPAGAALPAADKGPPGKFSRGAIAQVAWERLAGGALADGASNDALAKVLGYLDGSPRAEGTIDYSEWQWLRLTDKRRTPLVTPRHLRLAAEARAAGEAAAAGLGPNADGDERGQYALEALLNSADRARRDAEDQLLVGAPESLARAEQLWQTALSGSNGGYTRTRELAATMSLALATRDQALAEAPYWSAWIWHNMLWSQLPQGNQRGAARTDQSGALANLQSLLEGVRQLGIAIEQVNAGKDAKLVQEPLDQVASARTLLFEGYDQAASQLRGSGTDQRKLAALEAVLAVPLLDSGRRNQLRREYLEIIRQSAATSPISADTTGRTAADEPTLDIRTLLPWRLHPLIQLTDLTDLVKDDDPPLDTSPRPSDEATGEARHVQNLADLALQSTRLRSRLRQWRSRSDRLTQEAAAQDGAAAAEPVGLPASRASRAKADRLVRAYGALVDAETRDDNAAEQLRRADLHEALLRQTRRALDDFLGPGESPYFLQVAQASLRGADQLLPAAAARRAGLSALVERRRAASESFVDLAPEPLPVIEGRKLADHRVKTAPAADLPPGIAAYAVELGGKPLPLLASRDSKDPVPRLPLALTAAGTLDYSLPLGQWASTASSEGLESLLLYRGHERRRNVPVAASGRKIEYLPDVFGPPRVTVKGSETQTSAVMFIFDCSGSMNRSDVPNDQRQPNQPVNIRRMEAARTTFINVLTRMAAQNYQVGLMLYGHRLAWDPKELYKSNKVDKSPYEVARNTLAGKRLYPYDDIERVLDVGRFGPQELRQVRTALNELEPWGQTPLYMAIDQAITAMSAVDPRLKRRIIVITDGFDEPGIDPLKTASRKIVYFKDVQTQLANLPPERRIQLDLLGFNLTKEMAEAGGKNEEEKRIARQKAEKELEQLRGLASDTGGTLYDVRSAGDLVEALRKSLRPGRYLVKASGEPPAASPKDLNETWEVANHPQRRSRRPYDVVVAEIDRPASVAVELEGGEALELFLEPSPERPERPLIFRRYGADEPVHEQVAVSKPGGNAPESVWIGAHLPEFVRHQTYSDARFFLSVQNGDATRFSPRPMEVGAEIRPILGKDQLGDSYVFVEGNFTPDRSAPIVQFLAPRWPVTAQEAQIDFWCKYATTRPDDSGTIKDMQRRPSPKAPSMRIEADFGDDPSADYQVRVLGEDLASFKIDINPPPKRIVRQLNPKGAFVQQTFFFNNTEADRVGDYTLSLTSKENLRKDAIRLSKPLVRAMPSK